MKSREEIERVYREQRHWLSRASKFNMPPEASSEGFAAALEWVLEVMAPEMSVKLDALLERGRKFYEEFPPEQAKSA